jgi:hypothetical protein
MGTYVMSVVQTWLGRFTVNLRSRLGGICVRRRFGQVQTTVDRLKASRFMTSRHTAA